MDPTLAPPRAAAAAPARRRTSRCSTWGRTWRRSTWGLALGALALLASPSRAQEQPPPVDIKVEGEDLLISINEKDGLSIEEFIKLAESLTKKTFAYSTTDIQNVPDSKITFVGVQRVKKDNFFAFFQTMLYIKGFATLIRGADDTEIIEVVATTGPKRTELNSSARYVAPEEIVDYANQTGVPILTSIPLTHINANAATNQLRPFFSVGAGGAAQLTLGAAHRSLLLQGFGPQVYAAYQVLQLVDIPPEAWEQEVRVVRLEHAAAEELEPILTEILEGRAKAEAQKVGASGAELQTAPPQELQVVPHTSLNALLLSGTRQQIIEAQDLIARLDIPLEATEGDTQVIRLKNVLAEDLSTTLNRFITDDLAAERTAQAAQTATPARQPRKTVVVPHKESNSLVISATASAFRQLQRVVDELDRRQPQVLIECAVVELTSRESERLGIELGMVDLPGSGDFTRPFGFTSFGLSQFIDNDGDGIPDTRLPDFENPPQGFTGGIIRSKDFAIPIAINALAGDDGANVLSLPSIVVNNNETALVSNKEQRPTQNLTSNPTTGNVAGAGAPVDAGISLSISPSISSNNYLRLNVDLTVSRFLTPFDPNAVTAGVVAQRQVTTQVTMPSGHTMVLGGVIEDSQDHSSTGIPLLKDIPILGWLFSSWSKQQSKTNLYFFLTPYILDEEDFSDLAERSFRKKLEAAEYIGHRRIQLIDPKWRAGQPERLDDPGATIEEIDARGGFDIPIYQRPGGAHPAAPEPLPFDEQTAPGTAPLPSGEGGTAPPPPGGQDPPGAPTPPAAGEPGRPDPGKE